MIKDLDTGLQKALGVPTVVTLGILLVAGTLTAPSASATAVAPATAPFAAQVPLAPPSVVPATALAAAPRVVGTLARSQKSAKRSARTPSGSRRIADGVTLNTLRVKATKSAPTVVVRAVTIDPSEADGQLVVARTGRPARTSTLTRSVGGLVGVNGSFFAGGRPKGWTLNKGKVYSKHSGYGAERTLYVGSNSLQVGRPGSYSGSSGATRVKAARCKRVDVFGRPVVRSRFCGAGARTEAAYDGEAGGGGGSTGARSALTGRFQLLSGGQVAVGTGKRRLYLRHPRTFAGTTGDGRIVMGTIAGGATLQEAALIARRLGMSEAINLDGGGSSSMVVNGRVINKSGERAVADALVWKVSRNAKGASS